MPKHKKRVSLKTKWRKHKHTDFLKDKLMEEIKEEIKDGMNPAKKLKVGPVSSLFSIQTKPDAELRAQLNPDRFKKKKTRPLAKLDAEKVEQLVKLSKEELTKRMDRTAPEDKEPEYFDLWGDSTKKPRVTKPVHKSSKQVKVPVMIQPHGGQSINPSLGDQKALMKLVVDQVEKKSKKYTEGKVKQRVVNRKKMKPKTKKQAEHFKRHQKEKKEKERERNEKLVAKHLKEYKQEQAEKAIRQEERKKLRAAIKQKLKSGLLLPTSRHLGKRRYEARALEFKQLEEVEPRLMGAEATTEPLREHFDGIYRRGLLEPMTRKNAKKRNRLPKIKYHTDPNLSWKERNDEIQKFGILR